MCGIAGQVRADGAAVSRDLLREMSDALRHRGPDSSGLHCDKEAGLAIRRLRVIDLVTGDQPVFNEDRRIAVVLNGEIYNYKDLRRRLERDGHSFVTNGDTEVIAHLYEEDGPACVNCLHGMFAFAVWDAAERQLLLARDRIGKKPLVYADSGHSLTFSSELRSLKCDRAISDDLDPDAIESYLALHYIPAPLTIFRAVRKLPPGSILVYRDGVSEISRYWTPGRRDGTRMMAGESGESGARIRTSVGAAVARRLVADVPMGAFLSGGVDSAVVVATMAEQVGQVKTFSIGFEHEGYNELPYAREVARLFGTDHHETVVKADAIGMLPVMVRHYGEPFGDSSSLPSFHLAEMAKRDVTVALNGDGGDECFGGYPRYAVNALSARLAHVPKHVLALAGALGSAVPPSGRRTSPRNRIRRFAATLQLDPKQRYIEYVTFSPTAQTLMSREYLAEIDGETSRRVLRDAWDASPASCTVNRMLDTDARTYLPDDLLVKMDIATMAHSLEARSPFLDHEVLEMAAALPGRQKIRGLQRKVALRAAFRGVLPDSILDREKRGFSLPLAHWFRTDLSGFAQEILLDPRAQGRAYLRPRAAAELLERHQAGAEDHAERLWALIFLEFWHREFLDK